MPFPRTKRPGELSRGPHKTKSALGQLRIAAGLKQKDAAAAIGRHTTNLRHYERGHCIPSDEIITTMARLYSVNTSDVREALLEDRKRYLTKERLKVQAEEM